MKDKADCLSFVMRACVTCHFTGGGRRRGAAAAIAPDRSKTKSKNQNAFFGYKIWKGRDSDGV